MLIPSFAIDILTTKKTDFKSALERALYLRDNAADRIITFNSIKDFKLTSSFNETTEKVSFVVPRNLLYEKKQAFLTEETEDLITVGDIVIVYNSLAQSSEGYANGTTEEIFRGYVKAITPKDNIVIECEDEMWILKQQKITVSYPKITVTDMVKKLTDGLIDPGNIKGGYLGEDANAKITISGYRLKANPTVAQALHGLRKHFGIRAWFRTNPETKQAELFVGRLWYESAEKLRNPHIFKYQANIIQSKLKYQKEENYLKGVRAVSVSSEDNSRKEVFAGDQFGDQTTLHFFDVDDATLKELAENELKRVNYTGFFGSFNAVIRPLVKHGDYVKIIDPRFKDEREGVYVVEKVVTTYSIKGAWQTIYLNSKVV